MSISKVLKQLSAYSIAASLEPRGKIVILQLLYIFEGRVIQYKAIKIYFY